METIQVTPEQALESIKQFRIVLYDWGNGNFFLSPTESPLEAHDFSWVIGGEELFALLVKIIPSQREQWPTSAGQVIAAETISRVLVYNKNWDTDKSDSIPTLVKFNELMQTNPDFEEIVPQTKTTLHADGTSGKRL